MKPETKKLLAAAKSYGNQSLKTEAEMIASEFAIGLYTEEEFVDKIREAVHVNLGEYGLILIGAVGDKKEFQFVNKSRSMAVTVLANDVADAINVINPLYRKDWVLISQQDNNMQQLRASEI